MKTRYVISSIDQPLFLIVHNVNGKQTLTYDTHHDEAYATRFDSATFASLILCDLEKLYLVIRAINLIIVPIRDGIAETQGELPL